MKLLEVKSKNNKSITIEEQNEATKICEQYQNVEKITIDNENNKNITQLDIYYSKKSYAKYIEAFVIASNNNCSKIPFTLIVLDKKGNKIIEKTQEAILDDVKAQTKFNYLDILDEIDRNNNKNNTNNKPHYIYAVISIENNILGSKTVLIIPPRYKTLIYKKITKKYLLKLFILLILLSLAAIGMTRIYMEVYDYPIEKPWIVGEPFRYKQMKEIEDFGYEVIKQGGDDCYNIKTNKQINLAKDFNYKQCINSADLKQISFDRKTGFESIFRGVQNGIICEIKITSDLNNKNRKCSKSLFYKEDAVE